jgi:hypothetical protein
LDMVVPSFVSVCFVAKGSGADGGEQLELLVAR